MILTVRRGIFRVTVDTNFPNQILIRFRTTGSIGHNTGPSSLRYNRYRKIILPGDPAHLHHIFRRNNTAFRFVRCDQHAPYGHPTATGGDIGIVADHRDAGGIALRRCAKFNVKSIWIFGPVMLEGPIIDALGLTGNDGKLRILPRGLEIHPVAFGLLLFGVAHRGSNGDALSREGLITTQTLLVFHPGQISGSGDLQF